MSIVSSKGIFVNKTIRLKNIQKITFIPPTMLDKRIGFHVDYKDNTNDFIPFLKTVEPLICLHELGVDVEVKMPKSKKWKKRLEPFLELKEGVIER